MADNTAVNSQITDAITQINTKVLGTSPAQATGNFYQLVSASLGMLSQNAASHQQNVNNLSLAITTKCINVLLGESDKK